MDLQKNVLSKTKIVFVDIKVGIEDKNLLGKMICSIGNRLQKQQRKFYFKFNIVQFNNSPKKLYKGGNLTSLVVN